ncbi:MAG: TonB-dependent receptor domain-containing protein [Pyrinomonadaceae bacterium]
MFDRKSHQHRFLLLTLVFALSSLLLPLGASAQTVTGTLQGTVTDSKGAVVPGVDVVVRNVETGQERTLRTNSDGVYTATFLPLGRYSVTASGQGFRSVSQEDIEITLNQTRVIDITLNPGGITEAVLITSEAAPINTTNAEIKGSLNTHEILDKPVSNQGSFLNLAETFAGYQENPVGGQNNPTASSGSSINFNGTGTRGATFQINGVNNDDSSENQHRQGVSLATIKEFQVITNNFTAEFGRGYGAVVLVQTLSGTNKVGGSAYWFNQNSHLNATNNVFAPGSIKPVNRRNQFGFTTGFPILKNRLFGFVSLDHVEDTGGGTINRDVFIPSEFDPANWFKITPANDTPANRTFIQSVLDRFKTNNILPNDPLRCRRCFRGVQNRDFPLRDYSGRFDWNPREDDTLTGRWQYTRQRFQADDVIVGERADQNNKQQNIGMTWTHLFSPQTVGEFRYGLGLRTTLVNIAAGNDTPIIRFTNPQVVAGATIIGNAGIFPIQRYQTDHQFVYNITTLFGSHYFKAGTDIRRQNLDDLADSFSRGFYSFGGTCNGVAYRDVNVPPPNNTSGFIAFLNGCVTTFTKGYGPFFLENRINEYNIYGEDNWRVRPNLTLDLGLRYEYVAVPREKKGRIDYVYKDDKDNIEPRVGFAWSPGFTEGLLGRAFGGPGNSSIRGGYGIYHGRIYQSVFSQGGAGLRFNPPTALSFSQTGIATSLFNPNNLADPTNGFVFVPGPQATRHSINIVDPGLEMPYTQQWNLSIERQLPFSSALRVSYTGNRGIGLLRFAQGNIPAHDPVNGVLVADHPNNPANLRGQVIRLAADAECAGTTATTINAQCPAVVPIGAFEYSMRVPRTNERRPDGRYSTNTLVSNSSWSYYHGLQVEWTKKLSRGLNYQLAYTFSKAIDTTSEATDVNTAASGDTNQTGNLSRNARGLSLFDTRHRLTFYGTYRLPFFTERKDFLGQTLGGWQFATVVRLASGTPFTVRNSGGADLNFDGFAETRPAIIDPSILGRGVDHPLTSRDVLPRSAFRPATLADFGNGIVGRNTFFRDGQKVVDIGITKYFEMPFEGHRLMLRADLFNALNHVWYGTPSADIQAANFGAITGTNAFYTPRVVSIALRYTF